MRIALIGQKGIPAKAGGVEMHVENLTTRLVNAGHEVYVYARFNYTDKKLKEYKGVKIINLPSVPTKHLDAISHTFLACLDIIFKRKVDVVHFHAIGPSSLIWLIKIFRPSIPVIATFHCRDYFHKKWNIFARIYLKFGELICCKMADEVIAVSRGLKDYIKNKYNVNAVYIPNGVNKVDTQVAKEILEKWKLNKDEYILTVSRLVKHKGMHYLISAYNKLKTDKKLVIVGEGAFTDEYVKKIKELANGNSNIIFTGMQSGKILSELFSNAYCFVQPSESEGLSIALLEAMSYGKAVLVSDIPENKEAVGDIGFLFKNKDKNDLKNKLAYLLNDPILIEKRGKLGIDRVRTEYDWSNIAKNVIKIYENNDNNEKSLWNKIKFRFSIHKV